MGGRAGARDGESSAMTTLSCSPTRAPFPFALMLPKFDILSRLTAVGLVAVVRAESAEAAIRIGEALLEGGCPALEITFTVPGAPQVLEALAARYAPGELLLGAGTVLDPETARIALLSGATYVVSPARSTSRRCGCATAIRRPSCRER